MPDRSRNIATTLLAAGLTAAAAHADTTLILRGPDGPRAYTIADANAERATATRVRTVRAPGAAPIPINPAKRVVVNARVLVTGADAAALAASVGPRHRVTPIDGLPGAFAIGARSITGAADLADRLAADPRFASVELDIVQPLGPRGGSGIPTEFSPITQWTLGDGAFNVSWPNADVNDAWQLGFTGAGVVVGVVDEGMRRTHEDLAPNFFLEASDPIFALDFHASAVAGIIAMASNGLGGAGVAYNAQLSDHRYSFFSWQPAVDSILRRNDLNDIKNNSWGPADDGIIDSVPQAMLDAIEVAATTGRGGLGTVLVWAGGNGAEDNDRTDYDPLANSRHTLCIGAIGDGDRITSYSEPGASLHAVAYSSGTGRAIYTTSVQTDSSYAPQFGFTSAAAPLASGIVALVLEANPNLTARDVTHVIVKSARLVAPDHPDWTTNGAGHDINHWLGFGAVNALDAIATAQAWTNVGPERSAQTGAIAVGMAVPPMTTIERTVSVTDDLTLEHAELRLTIDTPEVGPLRIELISPSGTASTLADARTDPTDNYANRLFVTARCWDEQAAGDWTVRITNTSATTTATWQSFGLTLYGTAAACSPVDYAEPFGTLNVDDMLAFLPLFVAGDPTADLADPIGALDADDIIAFLSQFAAGCP